MCIYPMNSKIAIVIVISVAKITLICLQTVFIILVRHV